MTSTSDERLTSAAARSATAVHVVAAAVVGTMLVMQLGYSPMWDGLWYSNCFAAAARHLAPGSFRCAEHASHAYVALVAVVQSIAPGSFPLLLATNALLLVVAWVGFYRLTTLTVPDDDRRLDRALLGAIFVAQPTLVAAVVQPGLDLPIVPAFIWCVVFAFQRRWVAVAATGCALAFTKETGVLLYVALVFVIVLWRLAPGTLRSRGRAREIGPLLPLIAPLALFGAYLAYRSTTVPGKPALWIAGTVGGSIIEQFLIPTIDLYQLNYAALILVLGFGWILALLLVADALIGFARKIRRRPPRALVGVDRERLVLLIALLVVGSYGLTRFTTFGNPRYFLIPRVLLLVPTYASLLRLGFGPRARRLILATTAGLTMVSAVRTVDPMSRYVYGTFAVGEHRLLRMTSITGECCGFGRDQLVYNLEFGWLQRAAEAALRSVVPATSAATDSLVVVVPDSAAGTLSATWLSAPNADGPAGTMPRLVTVAHGALVSGATRVDSATLIALPTVDFTRALRELSARYTIAAPREFTVQGYRVATYRLTRRSAGF